MSASKPDHVVVVGAGYAGLPLTMKLGRQAGNQARITLINPEPRQELTCDLYRSLRKGKSYHYAFEKKLKKTKVNFIEGKLQQIDPEKRLIKLRSHIKRELPYDKLVLATGLQAQTPTIKGLPELLEEDRESLKKQIFSFKKNNHAQALKMALTREGWSEHSQNHQKDFFVVIIGAGSTGLEVAGELAHLRQKNRRCRIILVDDSTELLSDFSPLASRVVKKTLRKMGIEIVLGSKAKEIKQHELHLENNQVIPWNLLVLCAGKYTMPSWAQEFSQNPRGLDIDSQFQLKEFPDIYAIGDLGDYKHPAGLLAPGGNTLPRRAQFAVQSGYFLAEHLNALIRNQNPHQKHFQAADLGYLVSLGPTQGIGRLGPSPTGKLTRALSPFITGRKVDQMKKAVRLRYLAGLQTQRFFM